MTILKIGSIKTDDILKIIIEFLKKGGIIVCPTDTVYGFLADVANKKAVEKIYKIKKRPRSKYLPVFVKDIKMAQELAEINKDQEKILKKYWPGRFTFILFKKKSPDVRRRGTIYGVDKNTIALRIPKCKFLNDLLEKINRPLAQTSANISGQPATTKIDDILRQFSKADVLIIDAGDLTKSKPSKIIDLSSDREKVLRC